MKYPREGVHLSFVLEFEKTKENAISSPLTDNGKESRDRFTEHTPIKLLLEAARSSVETLIVISVAAAGLILFLQLTNRLSTEDWISLRRMAYFAYFRNRFEELSCLMSP